MILSVSAAIMTTQAEWFVAETQIPPRIPRGMHFRLRLHRWAVWTQWRCSGLTLLARRTSLVLAVAVIHSSHPAFANARQTVSATTAMRRKKLVGLPAITVEREVPKSQSSLEVLKCVASTEEICWLCLSRYQSNSRMVLVIVTLWPKLWCPIWCDATRRWICPRILRLHVAASRQARRVD